MAVQSRWREKTKVLFVLFTYILSRLTLGDRYVLKQKVYKTKGAKMKIWVDDIRTPPDVSWIWCKTSLHAVDLLTEARLHDETVDVMSLDHDLGEDDTTRPIVMWCCMSEFWPVEVRVHSANPVGIDWLEGMIDRYKPEVDSPPR